MRRKIRLITLSLLITLLFVMTAIAIPATPVFAAGTENAQFVMQYLNISQGPYGAYSHSTKNAMDICGSGSGIDNVLAPFSGTIKALDSTWGAVWLQSNNPVVWADGTIDYMTILTMHDNDITDLWVGKTVVQGEVYCQEGVKSPESNITGNHAHLECIRGAVGSKKWSARGNVYAYDALSLTSNTIVSQSLGYPWRTLSVSYPVGYYQPNVTEYLNLRSEASTTSASIGQIYPGTVFYVSEISGFMGKTTYNNITGWVNMKYTTSAAAPTATPTPTQAPTKPTVTYCTHVQDVGWQSYVSNGSLSGTSGQSRRLEAIRIKLEGINGGIEYHTHVQDIGWQDWVSNDTLSGTSGQSKRLEAIQIRLAGEAGTLYDVYYRVHAQNIGWMGWAKNGESAGTAGYSYRLEAIEIVLVKKGDPAPGPTANRFVEPGVSNPIGDAVSYKTHVQDYGWMDYVSNGATSGTSGQSKRMEAIQIKLQNMTGGIEYRTHVQDYGWMNWVSNDALSGTSGESKRLEAIEIRLTVEAADNYDIYYRVHAQNFGWMGWAKNGESAGTAGYAYRLEAVEIVLVPKGGAAPGATDGAFVQA